MTLVIDANAPIKWLADQADPHRAKAVIANGGCPDIIVAEVSNALGMHTKSKGHRDA
ncbi:MAG: hypothetical protein AB7F74_18600 [Parvibaculaceae bacterium]